MPNDPAKTPDTTFSNLAARLQFLCRELNISTEHLLGGFSAMMQDVISKIQLPTPKEAKLAHEESLYATRTLAQAGWTLSMYLTPSAIHEAAEQYTLNGQDYLDQWFVNFYEKSGGITDRLLDKPSLREWRPFLEECIWAYEAKRYKLVIVSVLPVLEGLIAKLVKAVPLTVKTTKVRELWAYAPRDPWMLEEIFHASVKGFLDQVWKNHDFDKDPPVSINRHWILHGRFPCIGEKADALKLLGATEFIADYLGEAVDGG